MRFRRFGKTELRLSVFSLGMMRCLASAEIAQQTLERAIALGINHIETAPGYGNSELYLAVALRQGVGVPRELSEAAADNMQRDDEGDDEDKVHKRSAKKRRLVRIL